MQKINLLVVVASSIFTSCQKEVNTVSTSGIVLGDTSLLVKAVTESVTVGVSGKATSATTYEYNASKKLIGATINSVNGNKSWVFENSYLRNGVGRIVSAQIKSKRLINGLPYVTPEGPAFDTSMTSIVYKDNLSSKINYLKKIRWNGQKMAIDSTVFEYDVTGHVNKTITYYLPFGIHQPSDTLLTSGYVTWAFNATGSLVQREEYGKGNGNSITMQIRYRFEYDDKINPLITNEDFFLFDSWTGGSLNNLIKTNVYIPANNETYDNTAVYIYQLDNKPLSVNNFSPVVLNTTQQIYFFYQ